MNWTPLRYRISDLHQLHACQSNNSKKLHIHVTDFFNDAPIRGTRVSVDHELLGTLFCYVVGAKGDLVTDKDGCSCATELSPSQLMNELKRFGFFVEYDPREHLSGDQITYLLTLQKLGYDKIRRVAIHRRDNDTLSEVVTVYVIGFLSYKHEMWLSNSYSPSHSDLVKALEDGSAINISAISDSKNFDWSWLDYVANINDIVMDNA